MGQNATRALFHAAFLEALNPPPTTNTTSTHKELQPDNDRHSHICRVMEIKCFSLFLFDCHFCPSLILSPGVCWRFIFSHQWPQENELGLFVCRGQRDRCWFHGRFFLPCYLGGDSVLRIASVLRCAQLVRWVLVQSWTPWRPVARKIAKFLTWTSGAFQCSWFEKEITFIHLEKLPPKTDLRQPSCHVMKAGRCKLMLKQKKEKQLQMRKQEEVQEVSERQQFYPEGTKVFRFCN